VYHFVRALYQDILIGRKTDCKIRVAFGCSAMTSISNSLHEKTSWYIRCDLWPEQLET
jgi:hypothetical protein